MTISVTNTYGTWQTLVKWRAQRLKLATKQHLLHTWLGAARLTTMLKWSFTRTGANDPSFNHVQSLHSFYAAGENATFLCFCCCWNAWLLQRRIRAVSVSARGVVKDIKVVAHTNIRFSSRNYDREIQTWQWWSATNLARLTTLNTEIELNGKVYSWTGFYSVETILNPELASTAEQGK